MTIGYAIHLSVLPSPNIGIKKLAKKRQMSAIIPKHMDIYRNGESNIFEEVIAAIPPKMKVISADSGCNTSTFPGNNPTHNTPRPNSAKGMLKRSFL